MKLNAWAKVKLFQLFVHIVAIVGLIMLWEPTWLLLSIVCWLLMYLLGGTIGVHRYWSHRSFEASKLFKYLTLILGTMMGLGSVLGWVGQHRLHHANSDESEQKDPYWAHNDYSIIGTIRAWVMTPNPINFELRMVKDLIRDKYVWFAHEHYFKLLATWIILLALINPMLALYCWFIPSVMCYVSAQVSGVFGHRFGTVTYEDTKDNSKDCHWLNIFSLGEGYQNTHHKYPNQIVMGKYDIAGLLINMFIPKR